MSESQPPEAADGRPVSRAAGIRVREADLGARTPIGGGPATEALRLDSFTVPGHRGGLAFVRFRDADAPFWNSATLARLVALRWGFEARDRATLDGVAAWPLAVVEGDDGGVVGCLVPLAAHPFYFVPVEEGGSRGSKAPQQVKWLVGAPKRARRAGAAVVSERDLLTRITVLARVCVLVELLHRNGVVFGDLSERSVLFGAGEVASAFVVGCEGAAFAGEEALQRNSAGWAAPEAYGEADAALTTTPSVQTPATDRYKLALLILRVLAPAGEGLERSRDPDRVRTVFDATGLQLMTDALADDASHRPSAADWYGYLRGVLLENLAAPVIRSVDVSPALVAEGDEVRLEISVSGAQQVTIELPGRAFITREVARRVVSERFTARQSGRISVRARNAHGEVEVLSDPVRVLPVPTPGRLPMATVEVPGSLGVLPDLAPLQAGLGIASGAESDAGGSPYERMAALRARLDADAMPLNDVLRIGLEAERASRDHAALFPSFEKFLGEVLPPGGPALPTGRGRNDVDARADDR
ncbi:hypothetical protein SCB71_05355 [Herbiconiux sp. KACC 21604]|uniref:hypothetical protein n=1 Tax=unclassified Herbiconiux TaxID=2618217 RepID=UPI0014924682|nr:hypothetical protein [Herbiconiux sp. SALV-R1]QJU52767.1 hypothetical protein HL652_03335 [Herbiconiux sp. SALV-R1]WPO87672.1 hypothetical protein SCB71_05355 [Herbiconiux sp. KACC 21604]